MDAFVRDNAAVLVTFSFLAVSMAITLFLTTRQADEL
jgi:hypothetical protein